ncbi:hypothetical protein [Burkholderia cenocepacia]|uniref:hypothetical protein n=1 Tax=Burkholderia cenocepacia TaxID=95486 RepID=UPI000F5BDBC6|nr:hypothetical protein [Burkholderia cenocepacia]
MDFHSSIARSIKNQIQNRCNPVQLCTKKPFIGGNFKNDRGRSIERKFVIILKDNAMHDLQFVARLASKDEPIDWLDFANTHRLHSMSRHKTVSKEGTATVTFLQQAVSLIGITKVFSQSSSAVPTSSYASSKPEPSGRFGEASASIYSPTRIAMAPRSRPRSMRCRAAAEWPPNTPEEKPARLPAARPHLLACSEGLTCLGATSKRSQGDAFMLVA